MIYDNRLLKEINATLGERRKTAEKKADYYLSVLHSDKDYVSAENEFSSAKFDRSKARFTGDKNAENNASEKMKSALDKMKKIQAKQGVSDEMLSTSYFCPLCGDTGMTSDGKRCVCFKKLAAKITLEELGIEKKSLPDFSSSKKTTQNRLDEIYPKLEKYCEHFAAGSKNLVISGSVGTGKSHLAGCVANELDKKNFNVVFLTACELDTIFLKYHTAPADDKSFYLSLLSGCDLLVIDDLGTEPVYKNVTLEYLLTVISERCSKNMPFIVTTNLDQTQLLDRYGDRILSRLNDKKRGVFIKIDGTDLRRSKNL